MFAGMTHTQDIAGGCVRWGATRPCHRAIEHTGHAAFLGACWQLRASSPHVCPRGLWAEAGHTEQSPAPLSVAGWSVGPGPGLCHQNPCPHPICAPRPGRL